MIDTQLRVHPVPWPCRFQYPAGDGVGTPPPKGVRNNRGNPIPSTRHYYNPVTHTVSRRLAVLGNPTGLTSSPWESCQHRDGVSSDDFHPDCNCSPWKRTHTHIRTHQEYIAASFSMNHRVFMQRKDCPALDFLTQSHKATSAWANPSTATGSVVVVVVVVAVTQWWAGWGIGGVPTSQPTNTCAIIPVRQ